jgi:hypothetical protein
MVLADDRLSENCSGDWYAHFVDESEELILQSETVQLDTRDYYGLLR